MTLELFFKDNPMAALGFSGGVDSSYLLYAGHKFGANIRAYFVKTAFQPVFELEDACRLAKQLDVEIVVIEKDIFSRPEIIANPDNRCYHCKKFILDIMKRQALQDGYPLLIDGTNASDDYHNRPGMRALSELAVRSPLRECGMTKDEVRRLSKEAKLFTWDKPSYACLATRIPAGMPITAEILDIVEKSEDALYKMHFSDLRLRFDGTKARLELPENQHAHAHEKWAEIRAALGEFDEIELVAR